jgi:hypothetical protein
VRLTVDILRPFLQPNIFQVRRLFNIIRQILWVNLSEVRLTVDILRPFLKANLSR